MQKSISIAIVEIPFVEPSFFFKKDALDESSRNDVELVNAS
jgi:hypothetical protein